MGEVSQRGRGQHASSHAKTGINVATCKFFLSYNGLFYKFLLRSEIISLYRNFMKSLRDIEDPSQRQHMRVWIRQEFDRGKGNIIDEVTHALT